MDYKNDNKNHLSPFAKNVKVVVDTGYWGKKQVFTSKLSCNSGAFIGYRNFLWVPRVDLIRSNLDDFKNLTCKLWVQPYVTGYYQPTFTHDTANITINVRVLVLDKPLDYNL